MVRRVGVPNWGGPAVPTRLGLPLALHSSREAILLTFSLGR